MVRPKRGVLKTGAKASFSVLFGRLFYFHFISSVAKAVLQSRPCIFIKGLF